MIWRSRQQFHPGVPGDNEAVKTKRFQKLKLSLSQAVGNRILESGSRMTPAEHSKCEGESRPASQGQSVGKLHAERRNLPPDTGSIASC